MENVPANARMTRRGETETTAGMIPHLKHEMGFLMPVKLRIRENESVASLKELHEPMRIAGKLIYALPGGGDFVSP